MAKAKTDHIEQFNKIIKECETFCFLTRDSVPQKEACVKLRAMASDCAAFKAKAVREDDEDLANLFLGFECVADSLHAELEMWVLLKDEKPDAAWDRLVAAQMAATNSVRAHRGFSHNHAQVQRLDEIERLVFPPQVFLSTGMIVQRQECSVCGVEYGECKHLIGKPYWGEICSIIVTDFKCDHVAIVENPADKRCRIEKFSVDGGERNRMTWKVEPTQTESAGVALPSTGSHPVGGLPAKVLKAKALVMRCEGEPNRYRIFR